MSDLTLIQSGSFTSTGQNITINLRPGTNYMKVWNSTAIAATTASVGFVWEWNLGMGGIEYQENAGQTAVNILPRPNDFIPVDTSVYTAGAPVAITATTNVVRPIVSTGSTAGLNTGSVVRLTNVTGALNLASYDFSIDTIVANTSFRIANALANNPGSAGTAGFYRIIPNPPLFYPPRRFIVNITRAAQAVVTTAIDHGLTVGQAVRFRLWPDENNWGMNEIDGLIGNIVAVTASTFTVDIDTTSFSTFTFPPATAYPFTRAQVVPVGEEANANQSDPNLLNDATVNIGIIGMTLVAGANSPGGQVGDVMYWQATRTANF